MDPVTLAATAMTAAKPYVAILGKEAAKGAAWAVGKSVWEWVKGKLPSGKDVKDLESDPDDPANQMAVQAALVKLLRSDPSARSELEQLLNKAEATSSKVSAAVTGNQNAVGQVLGSGSVSINKG
jgi:hypothetical protein